MHHHMVDRTRDAKTLVIDTLDHPLQEEEEDAAPQLALIVTLHQVATGEFETPTIP